MDPGKKFLSRNLPKRRRGPFKAILPTRRLESPLSPIVLQDVAEGTLEWLPVAAVCNLPKYEWMLPLVVSFIRRKVCVDWLERYTAWKAKREPSNV